MSSLAWGLVGPGAIAHRFADVVQRRPGMHLHAVVGRDATRAAAFAQAWRRDGRPPVRASDKLAGLLADPLVQAVYIATPHASHADLVAACLAAGKPVLCEKPLVATAAQARRVVALARERRVFLMEALWTRFLPLYRVIRQWLEGGAVGAVHAVQCQFCFAAPFDPASRLWNPALAGGALLDIGIYALAVTRWALETAPGRCPPLRRWQVDGKLATSGVDQRVAASLVFEGGAVSQFVCALDTVGVNGLQILGERGSIQVAERFWEATEATLLRPGEAPVQAHQPFELNGFEYQIDEVVRCLGAGLCESPAMPLDESLALAQWLDAARRELGVHYPFD
jgi:predicted dehydrogenase